MDSRKVLSIAGFILLPGPSRTSASASNSRGRGAQPKIIVGGFSTTHALPNLVTDHRMGSMLRMPIILLLGHNRGYAGDSLAGAIEL